MERSRALGRKSVTICLFVGIVACGRGPEQYLDRGNAAFQSGKYGDAVINYQKAIQKNSRYGEAYYRLGLTQLKQQKTLEGYRSLVQASDIARDNEEITVTLANICLASYMSDSRRPQQLYDQITSLAQRLLDKNPNSFDGLRLKGSLALLDRRPKEAIDLFQKANEAKPMQPDLVLGWSQALFQDDRFSEGEKLGLDLIQKQPAYAGIYEALYLQYLGANRAQDAENILKTRAANNPKDATASLRLAEHYARVRNPVAMAATLQHLIDNPKDFPQARLQVGNFYSRIGDWPQAMKNFQEGAQANTSDRILYDKGMVRVQLAEGKTDEAAKKVNEILTQQPKDPDMLTLRGAFLLRSGRPEDTDGAIAVYRALVNQQPEDPDMRFNLGKALQVKKDYESARTQFQEAVGRRQDFVAPRLGLAEIAVQQRKPAEALRYAEAALKYAPRNPRARLLRAAALMDVRKFDDAQKELTSLLQEAPQYRDAQLQLGLLGLARGKPKDAEAIFRKLQGSDQNNDPRIVVGLAESYASQSNLDMSLQLLAEEVKKSPGLAILRRTWADTAVRAGKYDLAIEQYRTLLSADPKSLEVLFRLGETQKLKGDLPAAVATFQDAARIDPNSGPAEVGLAFILHAAGRTDEAQTHYQRAIKLDPNNAMAMNNLAFLMAETGGNLEEALQLVQRASQKAPDAPSINDTLGWIYLKKNLNDSALQVFSGLVKKYPDNATFRYHLGMTFAQKGDKQKAKAELESALTKSPAKDDEVRIRDLLAKIG